MTTACAGLAAPAAPAAHGGRLAVPVGPVRIRQVRPSDRAALQAFYAGLSDESRRNRFFVSSTGIGDREATSFTSPDHRSREGFVALGGTRSGAGRRIVGHVCVETVETGVAEFAVAVADELQGRGIGHQLLDVAIAWARAHGFRRLIATMLPANPAIHRLATSLGLPVRFRTTSEDLTAADLDLGLEVGPAIAA